MSSYDYCCEPVFTDHCGPEWLILPTHMRVMGLNNQLSVQSTQLRLILIGLWLVHMTAAINVCTCTFEWPGQLNLCLCTAMFSWAPQVQVYSLVNSLQASSPPLLFSFPSPSSLFSFLSLLLPLSSSFSPFFFLSILSSFSLSPLLPLAPSFLENGSVYILQTKLLTAAILPLSRVIRQKSTERIHFLLCIML